jgi:hypothetical protein
VTSELWWWIDKDKHQCLKWNSNPRSQCPHHQGLGFRLRGHWDRLISMGLLHDFTYNVLSELQSQIYQKLLFLHLLHYISIVKWIYNTSLQYGLLGTALLKYFYLLNGMSCGETITWGAWTHFRERCNRFNFNAVYEILKFKTSEWQSIMKEGSRKRRQAQL